MRLHGRVKIYNETTKAAPAPTENWSVCNNFYSSIWSKVIVRVNQTELSDPSTNPNPYKSYIENLLNYSRDYQKVVMRSCHWFMDVANKTGRTLDANANNYNKAYVERREGLAGGAFNEFNIALPSDIITAQRFLPPNFELEIMLHRMADDFCIIVGDDNENEYSIKLDNIHITMDRYQVSDSVQNAYKSGLRRSLKPTIPITRNYIKAYPVSATKTDLGK